MASPVTLRLDQDLRRRVERIAKRKQCTSSAAMREAIETWVAREENSGTFFDSIKDLVGCVEGGDDPRLSENTGRKFTDMLQARAAKL